jgi:predicted alpha-1,6-mannanase (GH76 family)
MSTPKQKLTLFIFIFLLFTNCKKDPPELIPVIDPVKVDWNKNAEDSFLSLKSLYWNAEKGLFYSDNYKDGQLNYWWQAHALDAIVDASLRVKDDRYFTMIDDFYNGINTANNGFTNDYYDDMCWMGIALVRAYKLTGNDKYLTTAKYLWNDIISGWNDSHGGGICWNKYTNDYKNTPSNAPAAILSFRLYQLTAENKYLLMGVQILNWMQETLVDNSTGTIWDGIGRNGGSEIDYTWLFTYNQGVYIGACIEYYNIVKDKTWITKAIKTADNAIQSFSGNNQLLKDEGEGDGGLFKGILIRYLKLLTDKNYLEQDKYNKYTLFIRKNSEIIWDKGKSSTYPYLFNHDWNNSPSGAVDLSVELSAVFLIEASADLIIE